MQDKFDDVAKLYDQASLDLWKLINEKDHAIIFSIYGLTRQIQDLIKEARKVTNAQN